MNYVYLRQILHCTTTGCAVLREHPVVLLRKGTDGGGFWTCKYNTRQNLVHLQRYSRKSGGRGWVGKLDRPLFNIYGWLALPK